jgi:hypothetical protein
MDNISELEQSSKEIFDSLQKPLTTLTRTPQALHDSHHYIYKQVTFTRLMAKSDFHGVMVFVHNNTKETLKLSNTNFTAINTSMCDIAPGEFIALTNTVRRNFHLGPTSPQSVEHLNRNLTFSAGNKSCHFETSFWIISSYGFLAPTRTPTWRHQATSVGSEPVQCTSTMQAQENDQPYSYRVDIEIG